MSHSFPKNHSVKKITRRCFAVIVACFMAQAAFTLHAEPSMSIFQNPYLAGKNAFSEVFLEYVKRTGYDQALLAEVSDGVDYH
jgi:hypothetical protein